MSAERLALVKRYCYPERTWDNDLRWNEAEQCWEMPAGWMDGARWYQGGIPFDEPGHG